MTRSAFQGLTTLNIEPPGSSGLSTSFNCPLMLFWPSSSLIIFLITSSNCTSSRSHVVSRGDLYVAWPLTLTTKHVIQTRTSPIALKSLIPCTKYTDLIWLVLAVTWSGLEGTGLNIFFARLLLWDFNENLIIVDWQKSMPLCILQMLNMSCRAKLQGNHRIILGVWGAMKGVVGGKKGEDAMGWGQMKHSHYSFLNTFIPVVVVTSGYVNLSTLDSKGKHFTDMQRKCMANLLMKMTRTFQKHGMMNVILPNSKGCSYNCCVTCCETMLLQLRIRALNVVNMEFDSLMQMGIIYPS